MKLLITLLVALAAITPGFTQTWPSSHYKSARMQGAPRQFVMQLLSRQNAAAKTTITKERLIHSDYLYDPSNNFRPNLNIYDSSRYIYSGNNGSQFDLNQLQYNFPATQFDYDLPVLNFLVYGVSAPEVKCDTAIGLLHTTPIAYALSNTTTASYDAAGDLLVYYSVSKDTTYTRSLGYYNTYDGSGNVLTNISFTTPNGTTWDTATRRYFAYSGSGQLSSDSTFKRNGTTWYLSTRYNYTYDGAGHLTQVQAYKRKNSTAPLLYTNQYAQTYYPGGNLQTSYISQDTGTGMYLSGVDTFGYASGTNYFNYCNEFGYTDSGWKPEYTYTKHINAAGLPDTGYSSELIFYFDTSGTPLGSGYVNFMDEIQYNVHNDPVTYYQFIDFGGGYNYNSTQHFFYEPATNVVNTVREYKMNVYPNPVTDKVFVTLYDIPPAANIQMQLTDMQGRLISSVNMQWQGQAIQMPVTGLAAGDYYLTVSDAGGNYKSTQKLVKR